MRKSPKLPKGFYLILLCFAIIQSCTTDEDNNYPKKWESHSSNKKSHSSNKIGENLNFDFTFSINEKENIIDYANNLSNDEKLAFAEEVESSEYELTSNDLFVINKFAEYYVKDDFDVAIEKLQADILSLDLEEAEFDKYNQFLNIMIVMEQHETDKVATNSPNAKINKRAIGCAVAVGASVVSTLSLYACAVPTPALPAGCAVAIAGKLLSYAGMMLC